jgi:PKD repeat protein
VFFFTLLALVAVSHAQVPQHAHIVIVVEENHGYSSVIGTTAMPYLNSLAGKYGLATNYYADTHPSIGNYFMLTTGQIITNNDGFVPPAGGLNVNNIVRQLLLAGKTWKAYAESLPSAGYMGGDSGSYSKHHNPFVYFSDVVSSSTQKLNVVPFTQFASDLANNQLPDYSFVIPNMCHDAHDCSLTVADNWLQANIAPLLASPAFQQDGLLVILFDEANSWDATKGGGRIVWIAAGSKVKAGFKSTTLYQHQSTLRLSMQALGISSGLPGAATTAPQMGEFFSSTTTAPIPPTAVLTVTPTSGLAPLVVAADSSASSDPDDAIVSRTIDFGDGSAPATSVTASHTYNKTGSYTVKLTLKDKTSLTSTTTKTVVVTGDLAPSAVLTVSPQSGVAPLLVNSDSSGSSDPDGTIVSRTMNFGDGTVVSVSAASHTYSNPGSYTVTLSVTDNAGLVSRVTKTVTVTSGVPTGTPRVFFGLHETNAAKHGWPSVGFGTVRAWNAYPHVSWADINTAKGIYNWTALDNLLSLTQSHSVDLLYTLGRTPTWASSNPTGTCTNNPAGSCYPPANEQYWKDFVTAISTRYAGKIKYWELWNEPNASNFWTGTTAQLLTMARDAYQIIKAKDPNAKVLGPAPQGTNAYKWMDAYLAAGGGAYADIIPFHGYLGFTNGVTNPPELIAPLVANMKSVMKNRGQGSKQLWDTEHGWGRDTNLPDQSKQAAWLARHAILSWSNGVARSIWYLWDGAGVGTLWDPVTGIHKAGRAYGEVYKWLVGSTLTTPCSMASDSTWTCSLTRPGGYQAEIIWNSSGVTSAHTIASQYTQYYDLSGNKFAVPSGRSVMIGPAPLLFQAGGS